MTSADEMHGGCTIKRMSSQTPQSDCGDFSVGLRVWRLAEFVLVFVAPPALYAWGIVRAMLIPAIGVMALVSLLVLRRDRGFAQGAVWNAKDLWRRLGSGGIMFLAAGMMMVVCVAWFLPDRLWALPRDRPVLWAAVMVLYPLLSVYPQELIYRAFFFRRYAPLFGAGWAMVLMSAAAFSYGHLIFGNWIAVGLTFLGGLLFAWRYRRTRSLLVTSLEHALYGQLIFTVGLGEFFYYGTMNLAETALR